MNQPLTLLLDQTSADAPGFRFTLLMRNDSSAKLLLAFPEIAGLRFRNDATAEEAEWGTSLFVSAAGGGFALQPHESREFDFRVRTCDVERPEQDIHTDFNYYRWCVELPTAIYSVTYQFKVDADYFDPDSHWKMPQLERQAEHEQAVVWLGAVKSNQLRLLNAYPAPGRCPRPSSSWPRLCTTARTAPLPSTMLCLKWVILNWPNTSARASGIRWDAGWWV